MPETVEDLGKLVKGKYPDAYDALSDVEVGRKVKAKYPQYSQFTDVSDKPKLKPRTPEETKQFLQSRYGKLIERGTTGVAKQFLTGAGKAAAGDVIDTLKMVTPSYQVARGVQMLRGKPDPMSGVTENLEPQGPGEEAGAITVRGAEAIPAVIGIERFATQTISRLISQPGGIAKAKDLIRFARHPFKEAALKALEQMLPEEVVAPKRPGLKAPKYGGPAEPFDEGARRLPPRKPAVLPVEPEVTPYPSGKGTRVKYGGPGESFDEGAKRLAPRKPAPLPEPEPEVTPYPKGKGTRVKYGGPAEPFDEGARRLRTKPKLEPKPEPESKSKLKLKGKPTEGKPADSESTVVNPAKPGSGFDTGSEPTVTSIKHEARHTDAMRAVFANARNLGVDSNALRAAAKGFYGKGISDMTYEEIVDLNERLLTQKAVPKK